MQIVSSDYGNKYAAAMREAGIDLSTEGIRGIKGRDVTVSRHLSRQGPAPAERPLPKPLPPVWPSTPTSKRLLDLGRYDCRFPVGEAGEWEQLFCAEPTIGLSPYCTSCQQNLKRRST